MSDKFIIELKIWYKNKIFFWDNYDIRHCRYQPISERSLLFLQYNREGQPSVPFKHLLRPAILCSLPVGVWFRWRSHRIPFSGCPNVTNQFKVVQSVTCSNSPWPSPTGKATSSLLLTWPDTETFTPISFEK